MHTKVFKDWHEGIAARANIRSSFAKRKSSMLWQLYTNGHDRAEALLPHWKTVLQNKLCIVLYSSQYSTLVLYNTCLRQMFASNNLKQFVAFVCRRLPLKTKDSPPSSDFCLMVNHFIICRFKNSYQMSKNVLCKQKIYRLPLSAINNFPSFLYCSCTSEFEPEQITVKLFLCLKENAIDISITPHYVCRHGFSQKHFTGGWNLTLLWRQHSNLEFKLPQHLQY